MTSFVNCFVALPLLLFGLQRKLPSGLPKTCCANEGRVSKKQRSLARIRSDVACNEKADPNQLE